jgi:hypothetical protein
VISEALKDAAEETRSTPSRTRDEQK